MRDESEMVFLVGRWPGDPNSDDPKAQRWEVQGIYTTRATAQENAEPGWFIGELRLDTPAPVETTEWAVEYVPWTTEAPEQEMSA